MVCYFVTGASRGFGRILVDAIIKRGHNVVASARSLDSLADAKSLGAVCVEWDVTSPFSQLQKRAQAIIAEYGPIDILINNAGYIHIGMLEESSPEDIQAQFNANVFGALNTAKAFLPHFRQVKSGTIVNMGSIGGWGAFPGAGVYLASKYALRGFSATLSEELKPHGIRCLHLELGYFRTDFLKPDGSRSSERNNRIAAYDDQIQASVEMLDGVNGKQPGDPRKGAQVILDLIETTGAANGHEPPTYAAVGHDAYAFIGGELQKIRDSLEEWKNISTSGDIDYKG